MVTVLKHRVLPSNVFSIAQGNLEQRAESVNPLVTEGAGGDATLSLSLSRQLIPRETLSPQLVINLTVREIWSRQKWRESCV